MLTESVEGEGVRVPGLVFEGPKRLRSGFI